MRRQSTRETDTHSIVVFPSLSIETVFNSTFTSVANEHKTENNKWPFSITSCTRLFFFLIFHISTNASSFTKKRNYICLLFDLAARQHLRLFVMCLSSYIHKNQMANAGSSLLTFINTHNLKRAFAVLSLLLLLLLLQVFSWCSKT